MWSQICEKLVRGSEARAKSKSSPIAWVQQRIGDARRVPKFEVEAAAGGAAVLPLIVNPPRKLGKAADGNSHKQQLVSMAAGKRIPLIKFPNRRAGETQGSNAVDRASGGGGRSQAMPSLPSGTASSQPPRAKLSDAEIEAVLLGAVFEEPDPKKAAAKKK